MKYFTAHFWQEKGGEEVPCFSASDYKPEAGSILILEQMQSGEVEICLLAICKTEGLGELILSWKEEFPWVKAAGNPKRWVTQAEEELRALVGKSIGEVRVMIGVGEEICLLGYYGKVFCIKGFFGRGTAERMEDFRGEIKEGTGILLASPHFAENRTEAEIGETLRFAGECTEEKMRKHLRELEGRVEANVTNGAILLVVR